MFLDIFFSKYIKMLIDTNKALGVVKFLSDIYTLCVPLAAVSTLQLSAKDRIGVMFLFMAGVMYVVSFTRRKEGIDPTNIIRSACAMGLAGLVFRLQFHGPEADSTYLLAGTLIVTYVLPSDNETSNKPPHTSLLCCSGNTAC